MENPLDELAKRVMVWMSELEYSIAGRSCAEWVLRMTMGLKVLFRNMSSEASTKFSAGSGVVLMVLKGSG